MIFRSKRHAFRKFTLSSVILYLAATASVGVWWYAAFLHSWPKKSSIKAIADVYKKPSPSPHKSLLCLLEIDRDALQRALTGDTKTMLALITEWEIDARILEQHGLFPVKRLPNETFIKAQVIGRKLLTIADRPPTHVKRLLPQTYLSASFLLALTEPEHIVALPEGFRTHCSFFPQSLLDQISYDINRYSSETISRLHPEIAFVAHYSHPATLQALTHQDIPLIALNDINTLPEITETIKRIGRVVQRPLKAELLALFIESAMLAIDNRVLAVCHHAHQENNSPKLLFLEYSSRYYLPTEKTISGQLLRRLQAANVHFITAPNSDNQWKIPMDQEMIERLNPDCLIVACLQADGLMEKIKQDLPIKGSNSIHRIDAAPQAPNQFLVLAYYDMAQAAVNATCQARNRLFPLSDRNSVNREVPSGVIFNEGIVSIPKYIQNLVFGKEKAPGIGRS